MEEILDALRRIVSRWVETVTPINQDLNPDDTIIYVDSTKRFQEGDEVMVESAVESETSLVVDEIIDNTTLRLATPILNPWTVSQHIVLRKLINGMYVEGIYLGNPEVIPVFPAITINGRNVNSEWMTLDSTKERYEIELSTFVEAATQEDGLRFLMRLTKIIVQGLKANIFPLVNNYDITQITAPVLAGDGVLQVADASVFNTPLTDINAAYPRLSDARVILEDRWKSEETRVQRILGTNLIEIEPIACMNFALTSNPIAIRPKRFIYNSWPATTEFGTINKGSLLQASVIRWFAEEEVPVDFRNNDPHLK